VAQAENHGRALEMFRVRQGMEELAACLPGSGKRTGGPIRPEVVEGVEVHRRESEQGLMWHAPVVIMVRGREAAK